MTNLSLVAATVERGGAAILKEISLTLRGGSVLAIAGPNGSGKSTLLRCMAFLWPPAGGHVRLDERDLRHMPRLEIARAITYVPQEIRLDFDFSVREVVGMGRYAHRGRLAAETADDRRCVDEALARADVTHLAERSVTRLSGGERQRVLIARSLATRAPVLLLDEPTANLDVDHSLEVLALCRSLANDGYAVALASHDLNAVFRFADRVALLNYGCLVGEGPPAAVLNGPNLRQVFHVASETLTGGDGTPQLLFRRFSDSKGAQAL
jgi:iron complex transport system ATP-binding protein